MTVSRVALVAIALLGGAVRASSPESDSTGDLSAQGVPAEVQDLLLLGPLEPTRLRLKIEIDGVPFRTAWRETFNRLFDQFDTDRDGFLSPEQATGLSGVFGAGVISGSRPIAATMKSMAMNKSGLTRAEVREALEQSAPPLRLVQHLSSRGAGPALIPLLDTNGDGRLSLEELSHAALGLHCRDFNDDQLVTEQELVAGPAIADPSLQGEPSTGDGSVTLLTSAIDASAVAEILLRRYDRDRDGVLSLETPAEVQSGPEGLSVLDIDGDRMLTRTELRGYLGLPQDAELPFVLGSGSKRKGSAAAHYRLSSKLDGGFRLHVGTREINFRRINRNPDQDETRPRMREYDADQNDFLDAMELVGVPDRPEFAMVDSNHDDKILASEFDAFFQLRSRAAAVQILLDATEQGSDLFKTLDRNGDRVLTPRELQMAPNLIETEDQDGDGMLGGAEMTYNLVMELSRGSPRAATNPNLAMRGPSQPRVRADRTGPAWFLKMDRNRDGDVGIAEFPGSRKMFSELDSDGDGLLSAEEAIAASVHSK